MPGLIVIAAVTPTGVGTTRQRYRQRLADELGFWQAVATTAAGTQTEASRIVLADELRDDELGFAFLPTWAYVRSGAQADTQRRLIGQDEVGYQGSLGALMVSRPFTAALQSGVTVEVTSPLPCKRYAGYRGLNDCVDDALDLIWIEAVLTVTGNGTYEYDLAPTPYLQYDWQLRGVYDTLWQSGVTVPVLSPWDAHIVTNGVTRTLVTDLLYDTASTFYLHVIVRASTLVYDGSAWSYATTPGLGGDTWQAAAPEQWVLAFGMVMALRQVTKLTVANPQLDKQERALVLADVSERKRQWARTATAIKLHQFPKPLQQPSTELVTADCPSAWS